MSAALGTHSCKNLDVPEPAQLLHIYAHSTETIHQRRFSRGPSLVRQTCPAVKQPVLFRRDRKARLALYAYWKARGWILGNRRHALVLLEVWVRCCADFCLAKDIPGYTRLGMWCHCQERGGADIKECRMPEQCSCAPVVRIDWHSSSFSTDVEIGGKTQWAIYACSCRGIPVA